MNNKEIEKLYTVKEVASILNMAEITIRQWLGNGKIKAIRIGRTVRIPESEIKKLINRGE